MNLTDLTIQQQSLPTMQDGMALAMFLLGFVACAGGLWTMLARDYQRTLRNMAVQSNRLQAKALTEVGVVPLIDASTQLVKAVTQLIRTAMGVGAFLCLVGIALCMIAYWMIAL
ncbi:MAG: hypothetical protein ACK2T6_07525 [Anaerolineae bacterium]|jgi:uncharacterized membrane protein YidH (DUF202 family)